MRHALAGFSTGLSVVAAEVDGQIVGMPANSLVSVSLDPPLVSLSFAYASTTWPVLRRAERWGISVLGVGHEQVLSNLRRPAAERFVGVEMEVRGQAAFVAGALATIEVVPRTAVEAGDHTLMLLEVLALDRDETREPLVFFGSRVRTLAGDVLTLAV
ncbi:MULTISPECIES: flavin reductase family protein [unclassified Microbacterium]|uniref:flavin reductase family protein n=1 Tax=unclassified Microbacterium TaxID=2609290 RepID=UPI0011C4950D|nr:MULTISPECIES: flavin reductase family protein [unclassified Microbacterium]MBT2485285.1 flavin reductase [Microbacterium sp. ISL-108]